MKNILKMSLAAAMVIGLVGCGGNSSSNDGSGNLPPVAQPPVQQPPLEQPPISKEVHKDFRVLAQADWDLTEGVFITTDGYKWTRTSTGAAKNIAAGVYNSATWNTELLNESLSVVLANKENPLDWDLLVYDNYNDPDLFDKWIEEFGNNGVFDAGANKSRPNRDNIRETYGAYDAYGKVVGMFRAKEKGFMTDGNFTASVENVKAKLNEYTWEEGDNSYFKLIFDETGIKVHDYADTIDVAGFDAQQLGFAVRAYSLENIEGYSKEELKKKLLELAKEAETSLESIDALAGYNHIK